MKTVLSYWPYPLLLFGIAVWPGGVIGLGVSLLAIVVLGILGAIAWGIYTGMQDVLAYYGSWGAVYRYVRGRS